MGETRKASKRPGRPTRRSNALDRVCHPIGLDIGAETVEEIAVRSWPRSWRTAGAVASPGRPHRDRYRRLPRRRARRRGRRVGRDLAAPTRRVPGRRPRARATAGSPADGRVLVGRPSKGEWRSTGSRDCWSASAEEAVAAARRGVVPVLVSDVVPAFPVPVSVLVDARIAKKALDSRVGQAPFVVGLGPGFVVGVHCDAGDRDDARPPARQRDLGRIGRSQHGRAGRAGRCIGGARHPGRAARRPQLGRPVRGDGRRPASGWERSTTCRSRRGSGHGPRHDRPRRGDAGTQDRRRRSPAPTPRRSPTSRTRHSPWVGRARGRPRLAERAVDEPLPAASGSVSPS